jgi:hypothetical protein
MTGRFTVPTRVRSSNISQVVEELKALHDALCKVDQSQFEMLQEELAPVAERLVHSELLNSADKTIKLLVSCCIANILRLFAPDAPYSAEKLTVLISIGFDCIASFHPDCATAKAAGGREECISKLRILSGGELGDGKVHCSST